MKRIKVYMWKGINNKVTKELYKKYKDRRRDYMNVYIFEDDEEMYREVEKIEGERIGRGYGGRCLCYTDVYREIKTDKVVGIGECCGNIYFNKNRLGSNTVSHECLHAVIGYVNRRIKEYKGLFAKIGPEYEILEDGDCTTEELMCYMLGSLTEQIYAYYWTKIEPDIDKNIEENV